ncbi:ATP-binding cassette domain-containing protein [Caldicellulosiruptor obsidiansis]|uniref:ATP-binding cassette domain-containing protein n=1 Tax=Caldicellulosiruptor obsidiansis TaxID=717609 RepID=UPI002351CCF0|nr:ATP-binding cassette domain-containing protein [Caldicellulosiruptor obsidiansis]
MFTVHQELLYFPHLSVAENIFIDNKPKNKLGFVSYKTMIKQASEILSKMGVYINPETLCKNLGLSQLQIIEICRALVQNAKVLIFDEPTAGLTTYEIENLFKIIKELKEKGIVIIFVTNMVEEALSIADRVTILRDGEVYNIINELARIGCAIIFISSDFSELIGMCDRILVLHKGKTAGEFSKREMDYDKILKTAMGI